MEGQTFFEDGIKLFGIQGKEIKATLCFCIYQEAGRKPDRTAEGQSRMSSVLRKTPTPSDFMTKEHWEKKQPKGEWILWLRPGFKF